MATGRIIERKNGYGYVISAGRDPVTGKYKQIWRTGFKTKAEARERLRRHLNEIADGNTPTDMTVSEWLKRWLNSECIDMKPSTITSYELCVNRYLNPRIGNIRLDKLNHTDINRMYAHYLKSLSSVTVHRIHRTLKAALNRAIKRGILNDSPMKRVDVPDRRSPKRNTLNVRQAKLMMEWLKHKGYVAYYGAFLATYGGLRLGEVCGLQWRDVDLERSTLYIRRARQRHKRRDILIEPKTADSTRDIVLPEFAINEMTAWKARLKNEMDIAGKPWSDEEYVVQLPGLKAPEPHAFAQGVKSALAALGLPIITFHDLRHTHATWLLESGVDLKTVSQRLGHSSIAVTADVYSHVTRKMQKEAMSKLEKMIGLEQAEK
ncbi:site-specific integrase [Alicyclobacillus fastidiosus]|uniref:Tyrosine-type recombinase/integrase n=1 Tax=Alicyclobacillus fastidiosus TaxID=392011 RepID=A0ABV5AA02_9BACL|nr:tyrosine-type recombinase/integrase [Alicyclobacillus fastidiosus]WEH10944.1 tyrosine-type recombinase/integrase [Alicyclobacillus fastidiosus]